MESNSLWILKGILTFLFAILTFARFLQKKRAKENPEDKNIGSDATDPNLQPPVQTNSPPAEESDSFKAIHTIVAVALIVVLFWGIISLSKSRENTTPRNDPMAMVAELQKQNIQREEEMENSSQSSLSGTGHYPAISKGAASYRINLHAGTNNMTIDDNAIINIALKKVVKDTLYASAKMIYRESDQTYEGKRTHYQSTKGNSEMTAEERSIGYKFEDLLQKEFDIKVDNKGNVYVDKEKYLRETIPEDLFLHFLFAGLPPEAAGEGDKWHKTFIEKPMDKNVKLYFTITRIDHSTIAANVKYISSFSGGSMPCTGMGNYYLDKKTLLIDSGNVTVNVGYGDKYIVHINRIN